MIEKGEELWLMLIIHITSETNDSLNIIGLCTLHEREIVLLYLLPLVSANIIKLLEDKEISKWLDKFI